MHTIHEVNSAAAAKRYYAVADYYAQGQETVGQWGGRLAGELGLSGMVTKDAFDHLCDNQRPDGSPLTLRTRENRRVGYDFTVSVPKSASILRAFAGQELGRSIDAARDRAIAGMMAAVEADISCRVRVSGANHDRVTGNLIYAAYHHTTARPVAGQAPDMHEHSHLLCFNATMDPVEGVIKAGQFGELKRDGEYYSALFDSLYAGELEKLGFPIDRQGGKKWEIAGIPASMIAKFKKRTDEVEDEAARLGIADAARKAELGAKTRSKKDKQLTPFELRKAWDGQLTDDERDALARVYAGEVAAGEMVTPHDAVSFAIAHLSEQRSAFPERELKRVALWHGLGQVSLEQIEAELPRQGVIVEDIDGQKTATTETLQDEERFLVGLAARGRGSVCPVGVADGLTRTLDNGTSLSDGQWRVTQGLLNSCNRVELFEGPAGAGKSFSLQKYDEGMRLAGEKVTYLATTSSAVKVLAKDGFAVKTVAHFLQDEKMQAGARGGRVIIDESSMLGHKDTVKLYKLAEKLDLKLIHVGDVRQHGSVPRGALLRVLKDYAGLKSHRLTEIFRQTDLDYRAAAQHLSEGKILAGFAVLDGKGWVSAIGDDAERCRAIARDYLETVSEKKSVLVVSPTHAEAEAITREIRDQLRQAGKLGSDERLFTRLVAVNASEAERGLASTYRAGDVLQFHQNAAGGYTKGQRLTVTDPAAVPLGVADKFSLYRPQAVALSAGDKIRFTAPVKAWGKGEHQYRNGDTVTVAEITPGGRLRLDDGRLIAADAGHFRHAFVETSFGAQGQTVGRVILGMSAASVGAINQEMLYVSSTRARDSMALYTDDKDAVKAAIQRSSQKLAALDVQPPKPPVVIRPRPASSGLHSNHLERMRRLLRSRRIAAATPPSIPPHQPQQERPGASYGRG